LSRGILGDIDGRLVVASPLYKHHFDLATRACVEDDAVRIPVYAARLDGDSVLIGRP
jgi:nitrite reductase (NADH) small subunit